MPEICKKSLVSCPAEGGLELFIVGKNFLKDTKVVFQRRKAPLGGAATAGGISVMPWEQTVIPDKEYLQQVGSRFVSRSLGVFFYYCLFQFADSSHLYRPAVHQPGHLRTGGSTNLHRVRRQAERNAQLYLHAQGAPHGAERVHHDDGVVLRVGRWGRDWPVGAGSKCWWW